MGYTTIAWSSYCALCYSVKEIKGSSARASATVWSIMQSVHFLLFCEINACIEESNCDNSSWHLPEGVGQQQRKPCSPRCGMAFMGTPKRLASLDGRGQGFEKIREVRR